MDTVGRSRIIYLASTPSLHNVLSFYDSSSPCIFQKSLSAVFNLLLFQHTLCLQPYMHIFVCYIIDNLEINTVTAFESIMK